MKQKLRVGLMLDSLDCVNWERYMIELIAKSEYATIELAIVRENSETPKGSLISRVVKRRNQLGFIAFDLVERKVFGRNADAFYPSKLNDTLGEIPIIPLKPIEKKYSDYFSDEDVEKIKAFNLDIIIRLGFRIIRGEILNTAKYGIWSLHHGDNNVNRGGPAGFWEVLENWTETGSILQILTEDLDGGTVIYRSDSATDNVSIIRNRNNFYWKTVFFIPRMLKLLHDIGEEKFFNRLQKETVTPRFYYNRLYGTPGNLHIATLLLKHVWNYLSGKIRNVVYLEQWILLFAFSKSGEIARSMFRFKKLIPPKDRFWADPHVVEKEGRYYIFIEEYIYKKGIGHISVIEMDEKGNYTQPEKILEKPYHLSFPFILNHEGKFYMIPETLSNGTIELYEAEQFPYKWKFVKNLFTDVMAVDATVTFINGFWWLFANMKEHRGYSTWDELFLFYTDDLLHGGWVPHKFNPVISDVKSARPAGKIFEYKGQLYRPSQDCTKTYGYGIKINKILEISPDDYREEMVSQILPEWDKNIVATHTISHAGKLTVIDARIKRSKL